MVTGWSPTARSRRPVRSWAGTTCSTYPISTRPSTGRHAVLGPSTDRWRSGRSWSSRASSRDNTEISVSERAADSVEAVFREEWARLLAALVRQLGDLDLAE